MRCYQKPSLYTEPFSVEDVITVSSETPQVDQEQLAAAPDFLDGEFVNDLTVADPSGVFDAHISGGNPVQEALNTLYENFADLL